VPAEAVLLVHESPGEIRAALRIGGVLTEYAIDRPGAPDGFGDVHLARVLAMVPAMAGAFLALHDAEAFLPDSEGASGLTQGMVLPVRVTRAAQGGKGPRVSARFPGNLPEAAGEIRRLCRGRSAVSCLRAAYPDARLCQGAFDEAMEGELDALAAPHAMLTGGLRAHFAATPALTAIDLDGAGTTGARAAKAGVQMRANLAALPDLARQIALRNLSGAILVDFAGIPSRKRPALAAPLKEALAADRLRPRLAGFSPLGFAEIERRRERPPLHELADSALGIGLAALRRVAIEQRAAPSRRLALRARPGIVRALEADGTALPALARLTTYPLVLRGDPAAGRDGVIEDV
jgi:ribonuclease G